MIVRMVKVTVLCAAAERDASVRRLYDLGVLHLVDDDAAAATADADLEAGRADLQRLEAAQQLLRTGLAAAAGGGAARTEAAGIPADVLAAAVVRAAQVLQLAEERGELQRSLAALAAERAAVLPFGDFDPAAFARLRAAGIAVDLVRYPAATPPALPAGSTLQPLAVIDGIATAAVVGPVGQELAVRPVAVPERGLGAVAAAIAAAAARLDAVAAALADATAHLPQLAAAGAALRERVELLEGRARMGGAAAVAWLTGFCPADREAELRRTAVATGMVVVVRPTASGDVVPTLLGGPRWVRQVHSVFEGIGIVPGYAEADVSASFLVFLLLFAAMLIGDAGYGALLGLLSLWLWRRTARTAAGVPQAVRLLASTSVATVVWGAITGTWFAIPELPGALDALRIDWLASADKLATTRHIMLLCFLLGAIHLTIAHLWAAVRCGRSLTALAQFGWIACTWLMFALARTMVLGEPFPQPMVAVAIAGIALIVLFMTPPRLLKDEWFNHVMLPLNLVSNFVDVVSYLRLFAVGSAGVAVAAAFNDMAAKAAAGGGMGYVTAALIAVFGHTLNLLLCAMGVLVHGVRLNTLEFSAHLGLAWGGVAFRPFGRRTAPRPDDGGQPDSN